jgi:hypothetical protein
MFDAGVSEPLTFLIAGHHGGLANLSHLKEQMTRWGAERAPAEARERAPAELLKIPGDVRVPSFIQSAAEAELNARCYID